MNRNDRQLLIFDIDGVLVDVSNSYRQAIKQTAKFFTGKEVSLKEIQGYKNKGGFINDWNLTDAIIIKSGFKIDKEKIIYKFQSYYKKLMKNEKWLLDKEILNELSENYELAIFTGRPRGEAISVLENFGVMGRFSEIIAMEDVEREKPDSEGLLKILKKFNAKNAFYFGDTIDDVKAAINADVNAIGVLPPSDKSEELKNLLLKNGAKMVIDDINQIRGVLE